MSPLPTQPAQVLTRLRALGGLLRLEGLGVVVALHEAVGIDVDGLGPVDLAPLVVDVDALPHTLGIETQGDGLADQDGLHFEDHAP